MNEDEEEDAPRKKDPNHIDMNWSIDNGILRLYKNEENPEKIYTKCFKKDWKLIEKSFNKLAE